MWKWVWKLAPDLARPTRVALAILLLVLFQDLVATVAQHRTFAESRACNDPAIRADAGRYLDGHCHDHAALGDFTRGSAWIAALAEVPWQRLVAVAAGALCF